MIKTKKWMRLLAALAALSMLAAACGDDDDDGGDDGASADDGGDDGATDDGGSSGDGLVIGALLPESGSLSGIIGALRTPIDMAVDEINEAGGVLGSDVSVAAADDATDDTTAARASFERLVESDGIQVLLGPASSTLTEALMDQIAAADIVACSGSNTSAALEELEDNGHYFGFAPNDNLQGPALAEVIADDGHSAVAILARNDTYGTGFAAAIEEALGDAGVDVVLNAAYDPSSPTGYDADVQAVIDSGAEAVAVIGFGDDGGAIISQMIESGVGPGDFPIYTGDGMKDPGFWEIVGDSPELVQGIKGTAPAAAPAGVEHPFADAYAETGEPTIFSAYFYDCAIATALAAEAAGSTAPADIAEALLEVTSGGTKCNTFADCKELLEAGEDIDYDGASGDLTLNENGHVTSGAYDVWEYDAEGADASLDVPQIVVSL